MCPQSPADCARRLTRQCGAGRAEQRSRCASCRALNKAAGAPAWDSRRWRSAPTGDRRFEQAGRRRLLLDRDREIVPAGDAGIGIMDGCRCAPCPASAQSAPASEGAQVGVPIWSATTPDLGALRHQPQHRVDEIGAPQAHRPRPCARSGRPDRPPSTACSPASLVRAIDRQGSGRSLGPVGRRRRVPSKTKSVETWTSARRRARGRRGDQPGRGRVERVGPAPARSRLCRPRYRRRH